MARFSGNPVKSPLYGNESVPATDPSTTDDIQFTPTIITQFVAQNMQVANGSSNGLIDAASYTKLLALDTQAQTNTRVNQLAELAIPTFFSAPANGYFWIYQHVITTPWLLDAANTFCSAGTTNLTVLKNGTSLVGLSNMVVTTAARTYSVSVGTGSSNYTYNLGDVLGLSFSGTTGTCVNAAVSIGGTAVISS